MALMRRLGIYRNIPENHVKEWEQKGFERVDGVNNVEKIDKVDAVEEVKGVKPVSSDFDIESRREELSFMTVKELRGLAEKYDKSLGANVRKDNLVSLIIKAELKAKGKI